MLDQLRHLLLKQEWYREYADEHGRKPIELIGRFSVRSSYDGVAGDIREKLGIKEKFREGCLHVGEIPHTLFKWDMMPKSGTGVHC